MDVRTVTKRGFDLLAALLGLAMLAPLLLVIALAIKLGDGGPVFYRQVRVGRHGRDFRIWKFRTMRQNADRIGPAITAKGDPRITPVGRWLRASKLDELPQLFNVVMGEMSFVGPRPEVRRYVSLYTAEQQRVLELRPGITDLASIEFRDEETLLAQSPDPERFYVEHCLPRKVELNLSYARRAGLAADIGVLIQTFFAIVRPRAVARDGRRA